MLNPAQEEAKNTVEGPLLIIAGAGSGKTATLTARVEYMIKEKQIPISNILCVTFTNKAAKEMKHRIARTMGISFTGNPYKDKGMPLIGTFHSIGLMFLKENIESLGYKKDFVIYDESDKISMIKNIAKEEMNLDEKMYPARQIAYNISAAKNSLITPSAYSSYVDSKFKEIVGEVYKRYEHKMLKNNALDFDDILIKTLSLLKNPEILNAYQEKYKYIMVDEYQDTNAPQYEIVRLLAEKYRNLAVVGDDWQSIYSWRGADMRNIINFKKDYPEAKVVKLEQNYRSTKVIIEAANKIIKNNKTALDKTLWTDNASGEKIVFIESPDDRIEASTIAKIIKEKGHPYKKNLILYRTNGQSRNIEEALLREVIPYKVIGGLKFYERKEIKDLLAYLRLIHNPDDIVATKRIINVPSRKIGDKTTEVLDMYRENFNLNYVQIISNVAEVEELNNGAKRSLAGFYDIYSSLFESSKTLVVGELIEAIVRKIGYEDYLKEEYSKEEKEGKLDNIAELINLASAYNGMEARESLSNFLDDIALITDMDKIDEEEDFVTLMTIHTSKGLESDRVFVMGLEEGLFPHMRSINSPAELEEERRLMYVAMTRARDDLYITRARERFTFGNYISNPISRFMAEIPAELIENYKFETKNNYFTTSLTSDFGSSGIDISSPKLKPRADNDVTSFASGDRLEHPKFGIGVIVSLSGELAEIAFSGHGIKKMNVKIAPVKKI
ncbi:MAG: UvrD-helicase domain-containing protein [Candidatus Gracilibacteria bacterium]|nr:UvrD-helicase domain-containing protein [Candidatus Gracilibacteria bacterium]